MTATTHTTTERALKFLREAGFPALAARAGLFDAEVGQELCPLPPFLLAGHRQLAQVLAPLAGQTGSRGDELAERLTHAFGHMSENEVSEIEAVILRACLPRGAMLTVPEERLFTPAERAGIAPAPPHGDTSFPPIDLRQKVGQPIDYRGYLCAILKVTRLCNLRCSYCKDWSASPDTTMSVGLMSRLFAQALSGPRLGFDVLLHGGEPLMMGHRRFLQMIWLLSRYAHPGQSIRIHVQSNGTLVNARWIRMLALFDIHVSVSFDGSEILHNSSRLDTRGRPTAARVDDGISMLREAKLLSGVLLVVTPETVRTGAEALLHSLQRRNIESVCVLAERPEGTAPARLSAADYVGFLVDLARARRTSSGPWIGIREIDGPQRLISGTASGFCELAGNCIGHFITVEADGSVSHCDKYVSDDDYRLGNLNQSSLDAILQGARTRAVHKTALSLAVAQHTPCPHRRLCQGWCPHERYVAKNSGHLDEHCCGLAPLFDALIDLQDKETPTREMVDA